MLWTFVKTRLYRMYLYQEKSLVVIRMGESCLSFSPDTVPCLIFWSLYVQFTVTYTGSMYVVAYARIALLYGVYMGLVMLQYMHVQLYCTCISIIQLVVEKWGEYCV